MAKLGYIGLGAMGSRMADRLMSKGHSITGYNRTKSKAQWLVDKGMSWGDSPKAVAEAADVIFIMVMDHNALNAVVDGPTGLLAGLSSSPSGGGKTVVDMSTVSPATSRAVAEKVKAKGAQMLDCAVSGSISTLEQGKLTMMVGGEKSAYDAVHPLLLDIGPKATYVGVNGQAVS